MKCLCCGWDAEKIVAVSFHDKLFHFCEHCWYERRQDCFNIIHGG